MNDAEHELLVTVRHVLDGSEVRADSKFDYEAMYRVALRNGVANTVADALRFDEAVSEDVRRLLRKQYAIEMARELDRNDALGSLLPRLEHSGAKAVLLKGTLLCGIYPKPFIRSMSDVDLYAEAKDMDTIQTLMLELGYTPGFMMGLDNHYEYKYGKLLKVEYHPELVALDSRYGQMVFKRMHPYADSISDYISIWKHTEPVNHYEHVRKLTPEYHYVYVVMHMMNHFLAAGTGIRSVMDIWVMNRHYASTWNRAKIDELLADLGLSTFEAFSLALADRWFGLTGLEYLPTGVAREELDSFESYILESGTYGTTEHRIAAEMNGDTGTRRKLSYLLGRVFPSREYMEAKYPMLRRTPTLLPLAYVRRVVEFAPRRLHSIRREADNVIGIDEDAIGRQQELFDMLLG